LPNCHCEEERSDDAAIQLRAQARHKNAAELTANVEFSFLSAPAGAQLDCFAALAMTNQSPL
jgi:hypothetical protein